MASIKKRTINGRTVFLARWDAGTKPDGTRIQREKLFASEREAKLHANQMADQVGRLGITAADDMTLNEWFDRWIEERQLRGEHSPATGHNDVGSLQKFRPMIGRILVSKLRVGDIDDAITVLLTGGGRKGRPLTAASVKQHRTVLGTCLEAARKRGMRFDNPVKDSKPPKVKKKRKPRPFTLGEAARMLEAASASELFLGIGCAVEVLAGTGIRLGELLGLRWPDLDEQRCRLSLSATVVPDDKGRPIFREQMKSENAIRTISIPPSLVDALVSHRAAQAAYALQWGREYQRLGFIFPGADGTPMPPTTMTRKLRQLMEAANVPLGKQPAHAWRHLQAMTLMKSQPLVAVSQRLGHANAKITLEFYGHADEDDDRAAADAVASMLAKLKPKKGN